MRSVKEIFTVVLLLTAGLFLLPFEGKVTAETRGPLDNTLETMWDVAVAYQGIEPIDGVAVGELLSDHEGPEIITSSRDMGVYLNYYDTNSASWMKEKIWTSPGQVLTPAIGDLMPDKEGNEVLAVGLTSGIEGDEDEGAGLATVIYREGGEWRSVNVFEDDALIHGCAIGDLDPTIDGVEAVVVAFSKNATMLWYEGGGVWNSSHIYTDNGNLRKAVIADILPGRPGNEVVIASKSGKALLSYGNHTNWTTEVIYDGVPLARIAVGDVEAGGDVEIYAGTDMFKDGGDENPTVIGIKRSGSDWISSTVLVDTDKNRGVWVGDVDPNIPGQELYIFGYSTHLWQAHGSFSGGWSVRSIFSDVARGHEIRIGDLMTDRPGMEIAIVGYSSALKVAYPVGEVITATNPGEPVDGVAIGELLSDHEGYELISTSRDMGVYLSHWDTVSSSWITEKIWTSPGQPLTPAIGDLMPDKDGNEVLVVGLTSGIEDTPEAGHGLATVLYREGGSWKSVNVFEDEGGLIHGCDVGDLDPTIDGVEGVLVAFSKKGYLLWYDASTGNWSTEEICSDNGNLRKAAIADILPERPGNEVVIASKSGKALLVYGDHEAGWTQETIYDGVPLSRIAVGDVDPDAGLEIYAGTDVFRDGGEDQPTVIGIKKSGSTWINSTILVDTDKNRGVWVGDVDPDIPGQELYIFGYSTHLWQAHGSFTGGWTTEILFSDIARGHEIRIGDIMTDRAGPEIAICGYSNSVKVVTMDREGEDIAPEITGAATAFVSSGQTAQVTLDIAGGGTLDIRVSALSGLTVKASPSTLFIKGKVTIEVDPGHTTETFSGDIVVSVTGSMGTSTHTITVDVTGDDTAPTASDPVAGSTGSAVGEERIPADDVITITFSEPVSAESFASAEKTVKKGKENVTGVLFQLSGDGTKLTIDLNNATEGGTVEISILGLQDRAGNQMEPIDLSLSLRGGEEDEDGNTLLTVLVVIIVLVLLAVIIAVVIAVFGKKGKDEEERSEEENGEDKGKE